MSLQTTHNSTTTSLQRELDQLRQDIAFPPLLIEFGKLAGLGPVDCRLTRLSVEREWAEEFCSASEQLVVACRTDVLKSLPRNVDEVLVEVEVGLPETAVADLGMDDVEVPEPLDSGSDRCVSVGRLNHPAPKVRR